MPEAPYWTPKRIIALTILDDGSKRRADYEKMGLELKDTHSFQDDGDKLIRLSRLPNDASALRAFVVAYRRFPSDERYAWAFGYSARSKF